MFDAIGDMERFRLSRLDDLSVDDLLLSYVDFRGDFELSFGDVHDDLLLPLNFPVKRESVDFKSNLLALHFVFELMVDEVETYVMSYCRLFDLSNYYC